MSSEVLTSLPPDGPRSFLATLAREPAAEWLAHGASTFAGELSMTTRNSAYRFESGLFLGRARLPARSFAWPAALRGARLIGFLTELDGLWSLSPRWRVGARAVLLRADLRGTDAFVLTSPTTSFTLEAQPLARHAEGRPEDASVPRTAPPSGARLRRSARPPSVRRLLPASMTRIHQAAASAGEARNH
jgi:hypothetical protein